MIQRQIADKILYLATKFPVISLTGPRQSGKTTLVKELFPDHAYVNLEHPDARFAARHAPKNLLEHGKKGVVIDEAQYLGDIFSYIQVAADERQRSGEFILTGSQNFLLMEKITQSLAGRVAILNLLPFAQKELQNTDFKKNTLDEYIFNGFFPRLYDKQIEPEDFYPSYIQTYLERDVRQLVNVVDLEAFQRFLLLCAGRTGQMFNQSEVGGLAGIDQKTVIRWLSILKTSFQVFTLPPYFENFNKRIVKAPKLYFYDTGIACSLLGIRSADQLRTHFAYGALFENYVIVEMLKQFHNRGIRPAFYFWRDQSGNEIDLLIESGGQRYPIELKSSQVLQTDFFKGLSRFNALSGTPSQNAYLVYGGDQRLDMDQAKVRPWSDLPDL